MKLFIPGVPVPQARPRTFFSHRLNRFITTTPTKSRDWVGFVRVAVLACRPRAPIDCPVKVGLTFHIQRPKAAKNRVWAHKGGDLDNYCKSILDALQSAGIFSNDTRVVWLEARKLYAAGGRVGVEISVMPLGDDLDHGLP